VGFFVFKKYDYIYIVELISLLALSWWFTAFEPIQVLIDKSFERLPITPLTMYLHSAFGCWKCVSFWTTLIATQNLFYACIVSLTAYIISECLQTLTRH
jgi:hypothetical protein